MLGETIIRTGEERNVSSGVISTSIDVVGGRLGVLSGGLISECTVAQRGRINVYGGGSASVTTVSTLGFLDLFEGAAADNTTVTGGFMNIYSGAVANGLNMQTRGSAAVLSGGTAFAVEVNSNGHFNVYSGGSASDVQINSSGNVYVYSGGSASDLNVAASGTLDVMSGGSVDQIVLSSAAKMNISSGASAGHTTLETGAELHILKGGIANDNIVSGSATGSATAKIIVGGSASNNIIEKNGIIDVLSGGYVCETRISDQGKLSVRAFATASLTEVNSNAEFFVYGSADNTQVNQGALEVYDSGSIKNTKVNYKGSAAVFNGGSAFVTEVNAGTLNVLGTVDSTTVNSAGSMTVTFGGVADHTVVNSSGAVSVDTLGFLNNTKVNAGGSLTVITGGLANNNTITASGTFSIGNGGVASNTTIKAGANVAVASGAAHYGPIAFDEGAKMTVAEGGIVDFTIAAIAPADSNDYLINDLSAIEGTPTYTITVADKQKDGTYKLAQNAAAIDGTTISVYNSNGKTGSLTVNGEIVTIDNIDYDLNLNSEGDLILEVEGFIEGGTSQFVAGTFADGNVFELKSYGIGFIHNSSGKIKLSGSIDTARWELLDTTNYNNDGKDDLLWREIVYEKDLNGASVDSGRGKIYVQTDLTSFDDVLDKTYCLGEVAGQSKFHAIGNFAGTDKDGILVREPVSDSITRLSVLETAADDSQIEGSLGALVSATGSLQGSLADINANNYKYDIVAVGDFNGDGLDDILIQNIMSPTYNGVKLLGSGDVFAFFTGDVEDIKAGVNPAVSYIDNVSGKWKIIGSGDFNNDGTEDVLLYNGTDIIAWEMENGKKVSEMNFGSITMDQEIVDISDLNGDGTDDLLIYSAETNTLFERRIENGVVTSTVTLA